MLEEFVLPLVPREKSLPPRISIYVKLHFKFCLIPGHFNLKQDRSRKRVSIWTGVMDREHQKVRVFVNMLGHPGDQPGPLLSLKSSHTNFFLHWRRKSHFFFSFTLNTFFAVTFMTVFLSHDVQKIQEIFRYE